MKTVYLKVYIFMIFVYGLLFAYFTPPMQSPDENTHFYNSYALSEGMVFAEVGGSGADQKIGRMFPQNVEMFVRYYSTRFSDDNDRLSVDQLETASYIATAEEEDVFVTYWNADTNPISYIGPIIGMVMVRYLHFAPFTLYNFLIAGRVANLLLFALISAMAIKTTPIMRKTMILLLLMPETLSLASSLNYDALLIPTVFLLFSLVMALNLQERKITKHEKLLLLFISIVLLCVKQAYFPLLLLAFSIPIERFSSKKQYTMMVLSCLVVPGIIYLVYKIPSDGTVGAVKNVADAYIQQKQQAQYILSHLLQIPMIIGNSICKYGMFYAKSFFGNLGPLKISYSPIYMTGYFVILVLTMLEDLKTLVAISIKTRLLALVGLISAIILIFIGTYVIWTSHKVGIGVNYVDGVQGRYFIMLIPYFLVVFSYCSKKHNWVSKISCWIEGHIEASFFDIGIVYSNVCLIIGVIQILLKYWK